MKKLLLSTIILLFIILIGITSVKGIKIGKLNILGILQIKEENEELDISIKEATKLASADYQKKIDELNEVSKTLEKEKQTYEDMINISTENEKTVLMQTYENKMEFLFIRIENYAKSEGVQMKMDVKTNASGVENIYDLDFTVVGAYAQIEEFITHIEDDSKLGYKIDDFKMIPSTEEKVQATFICRNIKISGISSDISLNATITNEEIEEIE